jgi:hypothetical protein
MKQSMQWHYDSLANTMACLEREKRHLDVLQEAWRKQMQRACDYRAQIERAEKEGRDGFDPDRFGARRKKQR